MELTWATGISCQYPSNFHAGMDDARSRLQWAMGRYTTQEEDFAYSPFGIFDLYLPVLYGKSREKSLGQLLQEFLSQLHDISILHWIGEQSSISSYKPLPHIQPDPSSLSIQWSMSRLQQLVSTDDAQKLYSSLTNLPCAGFSNHILALPCIVHRVQVMKRRQIYMDHHVYDVQAVGLTPVQIITEELKEATKPTKLPHVLICPWNRKLVNHLEEDHVMARYKALMQLEQPFIAPMLV
ncbi:hypothetical protein ID866_12020 [Astraeus odoratus]|nr:hypothetical protein ID866_12020 [Astraeus odoratus]